jgi:hypothetical protein
MHPLPSPNNSSHYSAQNHWASQQTAPAPTGNVSHSLCNITNMHDTVINHQYHHTQINQQNHQQNLLRLVTAGNVAVLIARLLPAS